MFWFLCGETCVYAFVRSMQAEASATSEFPEEGENLQEIYYRSEYCVQLFETV